MTKSQFRAAFLAAHSWRQQRGPNDVHGHQRDADRADAVRRARTWDDICEAMPYGLWLDRALNRCMAMADEE